MTEIEQDPNVIQPDLLNAQQRLRRRIPGHFNARLARLVFDGEFHVRVCAGQLAHAVDRQLPQVFVIDLERIIPAILTGPDLNVVRAQLAYDVGRFVH